MKTVFTSDGLDAEKLLDKINYLCSEGLLDVDNVNYKPINLEEDEMSLASLMIELICMGDLIEKELHVQLEFFKDNPEHIVIIVNCFVPKGKSLRAKSLLSITDPSEKNSNFVELILKADLPYEKEIEHFKRSNI